MADPSVKPLMHIQVTTDSNIQGHEELIQFVETETRNVLGRFADQIMSVEVHFTDENGAKHGSHDKRCLMEARCSGRPPVAVSDESATIDGAFHGAAKKLQRLLESSLGKAEAHKGGETIRHEDSAEREEMSTERL
jgi:ribosome-associated translation inhibitor RaiA